MDTWSLHASVSWVRRNFHFRSPRIDRRDGFDVRLSSQSVLTSPWLGFEKKQSQGFEPEAARRLKTASHDFIFYQCVVEAIMKQPDKSKPEDDKKNWPTDESIPTKPEDTDASGDALNGTGEDNHHKK